MSSRSSNTISHTNTRTQNLIGLVLALALSRKVQVSTGGEESRLGMEIETELETEIGTEIAPGTETTEEVSGVASQKFVTETATTIDMQMRDTDDVLPVTETETEIERGVEIGTETERGAETEIETEAEAERESGTLTEGETRPGREVSVTAAAVEIMTTADTVTNTVTNTVTKIKKERREDHIDITSLTIIVMEFNSFHHRSCVACQSRN